MIAEVPPHSNVAVEPTGTTTIQTTMTELLVLMVTRIGESSGGDDCGIGLGMPEMGVVMELLGKISKCVDMVRTPLSMEMEEGVGLGAPRRRVEELFMSDSDEDEESMMLMTSRKWVYSVSVSLLRLSTYARVYEERRRCGGIYMG